MLAAHHLPIAPTNMFYMMNDTTTAIQDHSDTSFQLDSYDPETLEPIEASSRLRLAELNWSEALFRNSTVLDIGCGSGLTTIHASKLGASAIRATEQNPTNFEHFSKIIQNHHLPIELLASSLFDLDENTQSAKIVLCLNSLHQLIGSGVSVEDLVYKLALLTESKLVLEIPMGSTTLVSDTSEATSSNTNQSIFTEAVQQLQRYFTKVECGPFLTNQQQTSDSDSIVVIASEPVNDYELMSLLPQVNRLNYSLKGSNQSIELLSSRDGPMVIKKMPKTSLLNLLSDDVIESLFDAVGSFNGPILPAIKHNGRYVFRDSDGDGHMMFPFIGDLKNHFPVHKYHEPVTEALELTVELRGSLSKLPKAVIDAIKDITPPIKLRDRSNFGDYFNENIVSERLDALIEDIYDSYSTQDRSIEDSVIHCDLQLGNMITDANGRNWVVDLDLIQSGTAYTDFICCSIYHQCDEKTILENYKTIRNINGRDINYADLIFSVNLVLKWVQTINMYHEHMVPELIPSVHESILTILDVVKNIDGTASTLA